MRAAIVAEGKSETVALLAPVTVYQLASKSTVPEIVEAVGDRVNAGELVTDTMVSIWRQGAVARLAEIPRRIFISLN